MEYIPISIVHNFERIHESELMLREAYIQLSNTLQEKMNVLGKIKKLQEYVSYIYYINN